MNQKIFFYIIICISSSQAIAGIINETTTNLDLGNGNYADLQGLTWLTLDETVGQTRVDIENDSNGFLANGWSYASIDQVAILFSSLWNGKYQNDILDGDSARWFLDTFGITNTYDPFWTSGTWDSVGFYYGADGECDYISSRGYSCGSGVSVSHDGTNTYYNRYNKVTKSWDYNVKNIYRSPVGYISGNVALGIEDGNYVQEDDTLNLSTRGSLLVKAASIPEPTSLALLGLGLAGFGFSRKKKKTA